MKRAAPSAATTRTMRNTFIYRQNSTIMTDSLRNIDATGPAGKPIAISCAVMLQRWHEISFFHWSCEPSLLQSRLPLPLTIDTFDGKAWIGLTPFLLTGLRPPLFPHRLGLVFPEMNLRTYVL